MPIHDFQLSPSFLKRTRSTKLGERVESDAATTFEIVQSPTNSLSQFIVLDRNDFLQTSQSKQTSDDFKSRVKLERTNFIAAGLNASESAMPKLRPIEKVYLGDNFYKFNDGLIELKCGQGSIDAYLDRARRRMTGPKKANVNSLLRRNLRTTKARSECNSNGSSATATIVAGLDDDHLESRSSRGRSIGTDRSKRCDTIKHRYVIDGSDDETESETARSDTKMEEGGEPLESKFAALKAVHSDRIVKLYALPGDDSLSPGDSLETQILILVQHHYVNIWFQMDNKSNWKSCVLTAKKDEKIFTTELVRFPGVICLFCLATDMQSVYLKYCKIDLKQQNASFLSIETFKNISIGQFDFINLGQVTDDKIAISIPQSNGSKVDLYIYHLVVEKRNLKNLKKSLLHTFDLTSRCRNNCVFKINELQDRFVFILDQTLYIW
jgi:hypothetical protein